MTVPKGATLNDWNHFDLVLGLGEDLLPVIPDPNVIKSEFTKVKEFGKIPSEFDGENGAVGLIKWSEMTITPEMVSRWSKDRRYSLCVRASAVRAIDVDVDYYPRVDEIEGTILEYLDSMGVHGQLPLPRRERANSSKFLLAFKLAGVHRKRIITLPKEGGKVPRIEFLADGQQFLVAGSHPSGSLYQWAGGLPDRFPELSLEQFENLWQLLDTRFAAVPTSPRHQKTTPNIDGIETTVQTMGATDPTDMNATGSTPDESILSHVDSASLVQLRGALSYPPLIEAALDNSVWSEIGYALLSLGVLGLELFEGFSEQHAQQPGFNPGAARDWWSTHASAEPRSDYRHIFTLARKLKWGATSEPEDFPIVSDTPPAEAPTEVTERPTLRLTSGELHNYAREAERILSPEIYTQGDALVRIGEAQELRDNMKRDPSQRSLVTVTAEYIRRKLTAMASIQRFSNQQECWIAIDCPAELAGNIVGQRDWPNLRTLDAIVRAPFIRVDGSICDVPGYDARSGAFYIPNAVYPRLSDRPTFNDAQVALGRLLAPFAQFPYATRAAHSAFAAHILTEASRLAISNAPMFWYTAPNAGTGKTLLSSVASMIVHGNAPSMRPWIDDTDELRKTLFSSLLAGDRSIAFDNVPNGHKARAPTLCAFLTSGPLWQDRKLGASETFAVRNRAVVSASGNNVTPVSDMARRSLVIRLDASVTSNELRKRTFEIDNLQGYVLKHRVELLMAALTIIKAYHDQQQKGPTPLPSFEDWSKLVRDPLLWLGMPDPTWTQDDETDDESANVDGAFRIMGKSFGSRVFTVRDVITLATGFNGPEEDLASALMSAGCAEITNNVKVGFWLRDCRDKVGGGYKLEFVKASGKMGNSWRFRNLENGDLT